MTNNPIKTMLDEHEVISLTEEIIENLKDTWLQNPEQYVSQATFLIEFFKEYADGYHHRKEEDVLFPAINDHPDFILQEIIDELNGHHEDFREYAAEIKEAISHTDFEKSYTVLNQYVQELLDHIAVENDELFSLAESLMDESELETIYFKFKDVDRELGEDRKIEYEQKIQSMMLLS